MKKFICVILTLALALCAVNVFAADRTIESEYALIKGPSDLTSDEIDYQCSFDAELDSSYLGTWLYDMSENGTIHATITYSLATEVDKGQYGLYENDNFVSKYAITFERYGERYSMFSNTFGGNDGAFGTKGELQFSPNIYYIDESQRTVTSYNVTDDYPNVHYIDDGNNLTIIYDDPNYVEVPDYYLIMSLSQNKSEKRIAFFLYDSIKGMYNGKYLDQTSTVIVSGSEIAEKDKASGGKMMSSYVYSGDPAEDHPVSAFGNITEEDMEKGDNTRVIRGEDYDDVYDYNVEYTAEFTANIKNSQTVSQLSNDGNITATYYGISVSCKGKDGTPKVGRNTKLLRLKGNKLERWYEVSAIEYPDLKIEGAVIHGEYNKVSNDAQIYEGFAVIGGFDGTKYKPADRTTTNVGITYNYSSDARTFLKSLTFEVDGSRAEVPYNDIDYTGKFMSTFFGDVFDNSDEILNEMGL